MAILTQQQLKDIFVSGSTPTTSEYNSLFDTLKSHKENGSVSETLDTILGSGNTANTPIISSTPTNIITLGSDKKFEIQRLNTPSRVGIDGVSNKKGIVFGTSPNNSIHNTLIVPNPNTTQNIVLELPNESGELATKKDKANIYRLDYTYDTGSNGAIDGNVTVLNSSLFDSNQNNVFIFVLDMHIKMKVVQAFNGFIEPNVTFKVKSGQKIIYTGTFDCTNPNEDSFFFSPKIVFSETDTQTSFGSLTILFEDAPVDGHFKMDIDSTMLPYVEK